MPLLWLKMWVEALDDPKLTRLTLAERGCWWGLLKLAGKCQADGKLVSGGLGLELDEIADALHLKSEEDRQVLESMIAKMKDRGSLKWNHGVLVVIHYPERQAIPPSSRPENIADRVRRHREKKKPKDPREAEKLSQIGIRYKLRRKELGRELSTEERLELSAEIDKELDKKYGQVDD